MRLHTLFVSRMAFVCGRRNLENTFRALLLASVIPHSRPVKGLNLLFGILILALN